MSAEAWKKLLDLQDAQGLIEDDVAAARRIAAKHNVTAASPAELERQLSIHISVLQALLSDTKKPDKGPTSFITVTVADMPVSVNCACIPPASYFAKLDTETKASLIKQVALKCTPEGARHFPTDASADSRKSFGTGD